MTPINKGVTDKGPPSSKGYKEKATPTTKEMQYKDKDSRQKIK